MRRSRTALAGLAAGLGVLALQGPVTAAGPPALTKPVQGTLADVDPGRMYASPALAVDPDSAPVLNYLGYMNVDRGVRLEEAARLIEKAVAQDPENGAYLDSLGWAQFRLSRYEEAEKSLRAALRAGRWPVVRESIDAMSAPARQEPAWSYWYGRALAAAGLQVFRRDVLPVLAAVTCDVERPVVGAGPDHSRFVRRFRDRIERAVELLAGDVARDGLAADPLRALGFRGEVRREALPGHPLVPRPVEVLGPVVQHVRVVRRNGHRRHPLHAVDQVARRVAVERLPADPVVLLLAGGQVHPAVLPFARAVHVVGIERVRHDGAGFGSTGRPEG